MKLTKMFKLTKILAIIGIGLASYLLYLFIAPPHPTVCYVNAQINCEAATKGSLSTLFGLPVALYGLTGYLLILLAAFKKWRKVLFGVAAFGMIFCLRITFLELFQLQVLCPVCLLCQLDMALLFFLALVLFRTIDG